MSVNKERREKEHHFMFASLQAVQQTSIVGENASRKWYFDLRARGSAQQKQKVTWPLWRDANCGETDPQVPGLCPRSQLLGDLT